MNSSLEKSNFEFLKTKYPEIYKIGLDIEQNYSLKKENSLVDCRIFLEGILDLVFSFCLVRYSQ